MDPQACLQRIFDAFNSGDQDEYAQAFVDLFEWLKAGGAPPIVKELPPCSNGDARRRLGTTSQHMGICCGYFAIQSTNFNLRQSPGPFEFVRYNLSCESTTHTFSLPMSPAETEQTTEKGIEEHSDYCDLLDYVRRFSAMTKSQLVDLLYDLSGEGLTKAQLRSYPREELIVWAVDDAYGGTCH